MHLSRTLRELGYSVRDVAKTALGGFTRQSRVWIIIGATRWGFWRDLGFITFHRMNGAHIHCYIHNQSWQRLTSLRFLAGPRLTLVVLTQGIADQLHHAGFRASVLANTITEPDFKVEAVPRRKRLFWFGSVTEEKGFLIAYGAFRLLAVAAPEWIFDVYGTGPLASEPGKYPSARFHGSASGSAKQSAFAGGGIFILPSHYVNETQPLAIIEAMSCGIPVVASDAGGIREMICDARTPAGVCLPASAAPGVYAEAVKKGYDRYDQFSSGGRQLYARKYSPKKFKETLADLMR